MQEEKKVWTFQKGDIVTRIKPMKDPSGEKDYSMVGTRFIFNGIANASIYLTEDLNFIAALFLGKETNTVKIPLDLYEDGWAFYIEPDFITDESVKSSDIEKLKKAMESATRSEDFERADKLKKQIDEILGKNKNDKKR